MDLERTRNMQIFHHQQFHSSLSLPFIYSPLKQARKQASNQLTQKKKNEKNI
jgi:hypothetical protein